MIRLREIQSQWDTLKTRLRDPALFDGIADEEAARWFAYFFAVPKKPDATPTLRRHVLALYDPFAKRSLFPAGIRFSCNVYVGCSLQCAYCYIQTYWDEPVIRPGEKGEFRKRIQRDIAEIQELALPPVTLHFSNSTDCLQEQLESRFENTLYLLQQLAGGWQRHFSLMRMLTRNPARLLKPEYLTCLQTLRDKITVQVSLPIIAPAACKLYEPNVPAPESRIEAIAALRAENIPVMLRIDPLYPRDPLPTHYFGGQSLQDYGILPAQHEDELRKLVRFASTCGCRSVIYSVLKMPRNLSPRNQRVLAGLKALYEEAAAKSKNCRSHNYLRMPEDYQHGVMFQSILDEAAQCGMKAEHCKCNLIQAV